MSSQGLRDIKAWDQQCSIRVRIIRTLGHAHRTLLWCTIRGGTTGSKGQLISFFAADFRNDFQAFSWRFLNSATSI